MPELDKDRGDRGRELPGVTQMHPVIVHPLTGVTYKGSKRPLIQVACGDNGAMEKFSTLSIVLQTEEHNLFQSQIS
jgi:hypothetical protein